MHAYFGARPTEPAFSHKEDEFRYISRAEGVEPTFDASLAHPQITVELRRSTLHGPCINERLINHQIFDSEYLTVPKACSRTEFIGMRLQQEGRYEQPEDYANHRAQAPGQPCRKRALADILLGMRIALRAEMLIGASLDANHTVSIPPQGFVWPFRRQLRRICCDQELHIR